MREYLAEFLSDPLVVELPRWLWLPILHGIVLRTRPAKSAKKYQLIWSPEGSPLAVHSKRQALLLGKVFADRGIKVVHAMRYGRPSIADGLKELAGREIVVVPLYPQYSRSTTESVRDLIGAKTKMVESFHDHPDYIGALAKVVERHWAAHGKAKLVLSFHGLPKRSVEKGDPYMTQCMATAKILAGSLRIAPADYAVGFQSRFGVAEWLQPYTSEVLRQLGKEKLGRLDVLCPGFVSDCLETLEEIGIEGKAAFQRAGGGEFHALTCLNETPEWIVALARIAESSGS